MSQEFNRAIKIRSWKKPLPISISRLFCFHLFNNVQKTKGVFKIHISASSWIIKYLLLMEIAYHHHPATFKNITFENMEVEKFGGIWYEKGTRKISNLNRPWTCKAFSWWICNLQTEKSCIEKQFFWKLNGMQPKVKFFVCVCLFGGN